MRPRSGARGCPARVCLFAIVVGCVAGCGRLDYEAAARDAGRDAGAALDGGPDGGLPPAWLACLDGEEPIVLYTFDGLTDASAIPDRAPLEPDVPLTLEPRDPPGASIVEGELVLSGGLLSASQSDSTALSIALRDANEITVEAWARPDNTDFMGLAGPRRVITLSQDQCRRAFLLGQQDASLQTRLMTTAAGADPCFVNFAQGPAFEATLGPHHLALRYASAIGAQESIVNGVLVAESVHAPGATFSGWAVDLDRVRVGGENEVPPDPTFDRTFDGRVQRIAIYRRALSDGELACLAATPP